MFLSALELILKGWLGEKGLQVLLIRIQVWEPLAGITVKHETWADASSVVWWSWFRVIIMLGT